MTTIDASALAQARERLESFAGGAPWTSADLCADLRLVLDALKEARTQAFEEAEEALEQLRYTSSENDLRDGAKVIAALAAKEQA